MDDVEVEVEAEATLAPKVKSNGVSLSDILDNQDAENVALLDAAVADGGEDDEEEAPPLKSVREGYCVECEGVYNISPVGICLRCSLNLSR